MVTLPQYTIIIIMIYRNSNNTKKSFSRNKDISLSQYFCKAIKFGSRQMLMYE